MVPKPAGSSLCKGQMRECSIGGRERRGVLKEEKAFHAASPKTGTLRSLFTSFSHQSIGRSEMDHFAQGHREALVRDFCIECQLEYFRQSNFTLRMTSVHT